LFLCSRSVIMMNLEMFLREGGNRRIYSNLMKASGEVERSRARCKFLEVCRNEKVIPNSCKVKTKKKNLSESSQKRREENVQEASVKELEFSLEDEKDNFTKRVTDVNDKLKTIRETFPEVFAREIVTALNKKKESQFMFYTNQYKEKFQFLKTKQSEGTSRSAECGGTILEEAATQVEVVEEAATQVEEVGVDVTLEETAVTLEEEVEELVTLEEEVRGPVTLEEEGEVPALPPLLRSGAMPILPSSPVPAWGPLSPTPTPSSAQEVEVEEEVVGEPATLEEEVEEPATLEEEVEVPVTLEEELEVPMLEEEEGEPRRVEVEVEVTTRRTRRFCKKEKYRRVQRKVRRKSSRLTTNYSDYQLNPAEERVLNRGLNFCPQPAAVNRTKVEAGLERMARTVQWVDYYHGRDGLENEPAQQPLIQVKKNNFPPATGDNKYVPTRGVKEFIAATHDTIVSAPLKPFYPNLPDDEAAAVKSLKKEQQERRIIIKPNDKMGGQSVMNTEDYVNKVKKMLNETFVDQNGDEQKYYEGPLAGMYVDHHFLQIKRFLDESAEEGLISTTDAKNLLPTEATPGRFYGLVKNHKEIPAGEIIPPLRPVVSGSGSNTELISWLVDQEAKELVPKLESYWQDTPHALRDLQEENSKGPQPANAILVTADVVGLYSNIPQKEGMEVFRRALDSRPAPRLPTGFLMTLLGFVLTLNLFVFDASFWLQVQGTAMGTRVAPTFACLFMGWLETAMLAGWLVQVHMWRRFIDDCFFVWYGSEEELREFMVYCNNFHPTIKFTFDYNKETRSVNFLDIHIWIDENGYLQTDLYQKPGKVCQLLLPGSAHPSHTSRSLPLSIGYRVRRLCSRTDLAACPWQDLCQLLKSRTTGTPMVPTQISSRFEDQLEALKSRGYKERASLFQFQTVLLRGREEVMEKVEREEEERPIILSIPFDRRLPDVSSILQQHYKLLVERSPEVREWMGRAPMVAYQRPPNLRDLLVRAQLPPVDRRRGAGRGPHRGFRRCGKTNCLCCIYCEESRTHSSSATKETWDIKQSITCEDSSVVYAVTCHHRSGRCQDCPQYVGKVGTTRPCRERCTEHRGAARNNLDTAVGEHFNLPGHSLEDFSFIAFEKVRSKDPFVLAAREHYWIQKYRVLDKGLNRRT